MPERSDAGNGIAELSDEEFDQLVDDSIDEANADPLSEDDEDAEQSNASDDTARAHGSDDTDEEVAEDSETDDGSEDATSDDEADASAARGEDTRQSEAEPAKQPGDPEQPAQQLATATKPFSYRADKGTHVLPGSTENPDGSITVTRDGRNQLQQLLADAHAHRGSWPKAQQAFKTQITSLEGERNAALDLVGDLGKMSEEEIVEWAINFKAKMPQLAIDLERRKLDRERAQLREERDGTPDEQRTRATEQLQTAVGEELNRLFTHDAAQHLTAEDKQSIEAAARRRAPTYVRKATAADAQKLDGVTEGDFLFDPAELVEDFARVAKARSDARQSADVTTTVRAKNAKLNADKQPSNEIPPTVKPSRPAGEPKKKARDEKMDGRGWKKKFMRGDLDDDDE